MPIPKRLGSASPTIIRGITTLKLQAETVEQLITNNTSPSGNLDTNALQCAILQYRNTSDPETPAQCVFRRPIKDFILILPGHYKSHPIWREILAARKEALRNKHTKAAKRWTEHTKRLQALTIGDHARIQNQTGAHPKKWDKTGIVIEVRRLDQHVIRVDGLGRTTIRNRKFLMKYIPVQQPPPLRTITEDLRNLFKPPCHYNTKTASSPSRAHTLESPDYQQPTPPPSVVTNQADPYSMPDHDLESSAPNYLNCPNTTITIQPKPAKISPQATTPLKPTTPITQIPPTTSKKPPLAIRRLLDYNKKGLLEDLPAIQNQHKQ